MTKKLEEALQAQKKATKRSTPRIYGVLGLPIGGLKTVEVSSRNSYVYVRLRNNQSEVIQAFNNQVAPVYDLPVIVERVGNRYTVMEVDSQRFENNWNSFAPYLPRHGNTHSFNPEAGGGGDTVFVFPRQFMPMLVLPSGSRGGPNVLVASYTLKENDNTWKYVGNTGTQNFTPYIPNNSNAVMVLIYLDAPSGNFNLLVGSGSAFPNNITGTSAVVPYIPQITDPTTQIPIAAIRLVSGTSGIIWDNIYDVRQFLHTVPTGSAGGAGSLAIWDEGVSKGTATTLNVVGTVADISVSGSVARLFVTGTTAFVGLSGSVPLLDANGLLTSQAGLKWGLISGKVYLEFGANIVKEANAGRMGYQLFDTMFDIVGAGASGDTRWVRVYDALYSNLLQGAAVQIPGLTSTLLGTNATGTLIPDDATRNSGTYGRKDGAWSEAMPVDGWQFVQEDWTRTGNHVFTITGDVTSKYRKGVKVKYNDPDLEYGVIASSAHATGTTTINLIVNSDYAMAAGFISGRYISFIENPSGWPDVFNFTLSGLTAAGSMLPFLTTTTYARWKAHAKTVIVEVQYTVSLSGTASNQINVDVPVVPVDSASYPLACAVVDGTAQANVGLGAANGGTDKLLARKSDASNWSLGAGRIVQLNGEYPF